MEELSDEVLVASAQAGDTGALDGLVRRHQSWVFNLALRMVWRREAAEDATQEILLKAITKLSTFEGRSAFRTWLHRIAINHLLNIQKSEMEERRMTFSDMGDSLDEISDEDLPGSPGASAERGLLIEEAKLGCIIAMLMCLDRRQRVAFILGEVFGEKSDTAAAAMEITPENFRQLLLRARRDLYQFMANKCGLVNTANPCRCFRKAAGFIRNGWLDPGNLRFTRDRLEKIGAAASEHLEELGDLDRRHASLYREQPLLSGPDFAARLRDLLTNSRFSES